MLYRKYRPQKFKELEGLPAVSSVLLNQLKEGTVSHAYLFHGPRGTGKTTTARLLAKSLFCMARGEDGEPCGECEICLEVAKGSALDLIEIDAASNRGIDDIRSLRETVNLSPGKSAFKVYIIDEVHMLTKEAFNALLKTLEEPPAHAVFILCTTEFNKVPETILSRCLRFTFQSAQEDFLIAKLKRINQAEKYGFEDEVLKKIARKSAGGFRDAETLLEQVARAGPEHLPFLLEKGNLCLPAFCHSLLVGDSRTALVILGQYLEGGGVLEYFSESLVKYLRQILLLHAGFLDESSISDSEGREWGLNEGRNIPETCLELMLTKFTHALSNPSPEVVKSLSIELAIIDLCRQLPGLVGENPPVEVKITEEVQPQVEVGDLTKVVEKWPEILAKVKPHNHSIEALLRSCRPLSFTDNTLLIETAYQFHKDRLTTPTSLRVLKGVVSEVLGTNVDVSFHMGEKPPQVEEKSTLPCEKPLPDSVSVDSDGLALFTTEIL